MSKFIDMTGWVMSEHGVPDSKWTIIEKADPPENVKDKHHTYWLCECSCENNTQKILDGNSVKSGRTKSCGCSKFTGLYVSDYGELMKEWDWHKNNENGFDPYTIRSGSDQKVSWICAKQHRWDAAVNNRTSGKTTCPYCSGLLPIVGETDLETTHPNLALEWNYEKNGELRPTHVKAGSNKKVWWKCEREHEWFATIADRKKGAGCPTCAKEKHTSFPEQAVYYYLKQHNIVLNREKVFGKEIDIYLPNINVGVEYNGKYYHKNRDKKDNEKIQFLKNNGVNVYTIKEDEEDFIVGNIIHYRYGKSLDWAIINLCQLINITIPIIDIKKDRIKIYEQYILSEKERSLANKKPDVAAEWHPIKNGNLTPDLISCSSNKIVWWLGKCGHEYDMSVDKRTYGYGCPICSGRRIVVGVNDLATTHPHLLDIWDYENNTNITPQQITFGSNKKVWWKCPLGHSYQMRVHHKVGGIGCPLCSGHITLTGFNDFATKHPELLSEWDYEKNTILPTEIPQCSNKKVWWKCQCGHSWKATTNNRVAGSVCPKCAKVNRIISFGKTRNKSGVVGVSLHKSINKWHAKMRFNGKDISLKYFDNKDDAIKARLNKEVEVYGYDNAPQRHLFEQYGITQQNDLTEEEDEI